MLFTELQNLYFGWLDLFFISALSWQLSIATNCLYFRLPLPIMSSKMRRLQCTTCKRVRHQVSFSTTQLSSTTPICSLCVWPTRKCTSCEKILQKNSFTRSQWVSVHSVCNSCNVRLAKQCSYCKVHRQKNQFVPKEWHSVSGICNICWSQDEDESDEPVNVIITKTSCTWMYTLFITINGCLFNKIYRICSFYVLNF